MPTRIVPMDRYLIPQLPFHEERPELHLWPINYAIYYYPVEENYFHDRNGIKVTTLKFEKVKGNFLCAHIQHGVCRLSQWSVAGWDSISECGESFVRKVLSGVTGLHQQSEKH